MTVTCDITFQINGEGVDVSFRKRIDLPFLPAAGSVVKAAAWICRVADCPIYDLHTRVADVWLRSVPKGVVTWKDVKSQMEQHGWSLVDTLDVDLPSCFRD